MNTTAKFQGVEIWVHVSQLKRAPADILSCANVGDFKIKLTRKRSSCHQGRLLPLRCWIKNISFDSPFSFCHPFSNYYTVKGFVILLFTFYLSLAWKDNAIFHLSQATAKWVVIQTPNDCWICYNDGVPVILPITNFSLIFNASVSLELYRVSLCIMSYSLIMRVHFPASG